MIKSNVKQATKTWLIERIVKLEKEILTCDEKEFKGKMEILICNKFALENIEKGK